MERVKFISSFNLNQIIILFSTLGPRLVWRTRVLCFHFGKGKCFYNAYNRQISHEIYLLHLHRIYLNIFKLQVSWFYVMYCCWLMICLIAVICMIVWTDCFMVVIWCMISYDVMLLWLFECTSNWILSG